MPKFSANLTTLYQEFEFSQRFIAAAEDGFKAIEILDPYVWSIDQINAWLAESGLQLLLINTSKGNANDMGLAAVPGREKDFKESFIQALEYATALKTPMIHVLAGNTGGFTPEAEATFLHNLDWAADQAGSEQISLMLEPLNTQDVSGYFYTRSAEVAGLIKKLNRDNVKLQYDLYHMQIMEGNLAKNLEQHFDILGHVQFSSVPGRHEPQYGEVNVNFLFQHLDALGYRGWIGCEYSALGGTREGLSWGAAYHLGTHSGTQTA